MRFRTVILQGDKTATGIRIPDDVVEGLASGKKPKVRLTIKGYTYRSSIAIVDGRPIVGVSEGVRRNAGVAGGDEVDVDIELDTAPREVTVPEDFGAALDRDPAARIFFDSLSYSNRQRFVLSVQDAKTPETRQRRIEKSVAMLHEGRDR